MTQIDTDKPPKERMNIGNEIISRQQLTEGRSAMVGEFTTHDVRRALSMAGVCGVDRAADRLMQAERKAGRIAVSPTNKRKWIKL